MNKLPKLKDDLETTYFIALMDFLREEAKLSRVDPEKETEFMLLTLMRLIAKEKTGKGTLDRYVIFKANEA